MTQVHRYPLRADGIEQEPQTARLVSMDFSDLFPWLKNAAGLCRVDARLDRPS
jgi:hypothetical protein